MPLEHFSKVGRTGNRIELEIILRSLGTAVATPNFSVNLGHIAIQKHFHYFTHYITCTYQFGLAASSGAKTVHPIWLKGD